MAREQVPSSRQQCLADELRRARVAAGFSARELARRAGTSAQAVLRAEQGGDIDVVTVARFARALPELDPGCALGRTGAARPFSRAMHDHFGRLFGASLEHAVVEAHVDRDGRQRVGLVLEDLRRTTATSDPTATLIALVTLAGGLLGGSDELVARLHDQLASGERRATLWDGDIEHVVRRHGRDRLSYRRIDHGPPRPPDADALGQVRHGGPFERGVALQLDLPARRVTFRIRFDDPDAGPVEAATWPAAFGADADAAATWWAEAHPFARRRVTPDARGVAVLVIEHVPPWACIGVGWTREADNGRGDADASPLHVTPWSGSLGEAVVSARRAEGISRRALGRRASMSAASAIALERARMPRLSTARRLLDALPALTPGLLLECIAPLDAGSLDAAAAWALQRDAHGVLVDEERREFVVAPDGTVTATARTKGMTWTPRAEAGLHLRFGTLRAPGPTPRVLERVYETPDRGEARVRILERQGGTLVHELRFAAPAADERSSRRSSFTRRARLAGQYPLSAGVVSSDDLAPADRWRSARPDGRVAEAFHVELGLPARRLAIRVDLPATCRAADVQAKATARAAHPVEAASDLAPLLHGAPLAARRSGASRLHLSVERPLVGVRYAISWIPRRRDD